MRKTFQIVLFLTVDSAAQTRRIKLVEPSEIFIDGTHIKVSANKKKLQKEQVRKTAKVYSEQLRREVNAKRKMLGKKPIEDDDDDSDGGETVEKTVSMTDSDCGMFVKGEHETQFAFEAHTACDKKGFVLGVEVTAGNVHDSVAWVKVYGYVTGRYSKYDYKNKDTDNSRNGHSGKTLRTSFGDVEVSVLRDRRRAEVGCFACFLIVILHKKLKQ